MHMAQVFVRWKCGCIVGPHRFCAKAAEGRACRK
jgi:hypothetical protein